MIYGVAVQNDQLQGPREFENALDFRLDLREIGGARVCALHQRSLGRVVQQGTLRQGNVRSHPGYYYSGVSMTTVNFFPWLLNS